MGEQENLEALICKYFEKLYNCIKGLMEMVHALMISMYNSIIYSVSLVMYICRFLLILLILVITIVSL